MMGRSQRVARNILSLLLTQGATWALTMVVTLFLPAYLGATGLGRLTLAGAISGIAFLFVYLGTSTVLVRDVAREPGRAGDYLWAVLWQRLALGLLVTLLAAAAVRLTAYGPQVRGLIVLSCVVGIAAALSSGAGDVLRGLEDFPRVNAAQVLEKVVFGVLTLAAVRARLPLWAFVACYGAASLVSLAAILAALAGRLPRPGRAHLAVGRRIMAEGWPFFANALFMVIYSQCHPIILERLSGDAAVGWYGLVTRLFGAALFVPSIITGAMLPALSRLHQEDPRRFAEPAGRMVCLILLCAAPIAAVIIAMPAQLIQALHYPPSFSHAVPVFRFFGVGVVLWFLSIAVGTVMTAMGLQREFSRASAVAAALVVPISVGCIWATQRAFHNGAIGAAISHIVVETYMLYRYLRVLPPGLLPVRQMTALGGRLAASALPMALLVGALHGGLVLPALAAGLALYVLLCVLTRCLTSADVSLLLSVVRRKAMAPAPG